MNNLKEILAKPQEDAKEMIIENIKNLLDETKSHQIICFGAGLAGGGIYNLLKEHNLDNLIKCYADNNPAKQGTLFNNIQVLSCDSAFADYTDELVIISCSEAESVINQLKAYKVPDNRLYIPDINTVFNDDAKYIWEHVNQLSSIYNLLSDKKSKDVFVALLNYRITRDVKLIKQIADNPSDQYFDKDLISYDKDDIFVDCGGFTGDTCEEYKKHSGGVYKKIISFEVDADNCKIIKSKEKELKIELVEAPCWSDVRTVHFDKIGSASGNIKGGEKDPSKVTVVELQTETIDNAVGNQKASFIKMDIEGAEYDALLGARQTIERDKPTLMISAYHEQDDFLRLPMLILSMVPDYHLYLRHYRYLYAQETVLYAIYK